MPLSSYKRNLSFFIFGLFLLVLGMIIEFLLAMILPNEVMSLFYTHGVFLSLIIICFASGLILLRRSIFGWWYSQYDFVVFLIAAFLCSFSALQTMVHLQADHPFLHLSNTNPVLMYLLWIFILPPMNPLTLISLSIALIVIAIWIYVKTKENLSVVHIKALKKKALQDLPRWRTLVRLIRINVWIGSIFLLSLAFIILGSPPLSPPPLIPLYYPITWIRFLVALVAASLLNSFIFIQNQLGDLDTDRLHHEKSQLPLAANHLPKRSVLIIAIIFVLCALVLAILVSGTYFIILLGIVILGILYSSSPLRLKSKPIMDLVMIGLAFGVMAVLAAWGIHLTMPSLPALFLLGPGLFYAGTHGIHTASDYYADNQAGVNTTAVVLGPKRAIKLGIILVAIGLICLYATVGFYTHIFWYGLLKYKSIFLITFCGLPFFAILYTSRMIFRTESTDQQYIKQLEQEGRIATYLLFTILLIYCLLYVFLFYSVYYPSYTFPWK